MLIWINTAPRKGKRSRPGDWAGSLDPVVGDGEGGDSTGFPEIQRTEPTATARPSLMETQAPEFFDDWRFR